MLSTGEYVGDHGGEACDLQTVDEKTTVMLQTIKKQRTAKRKTRVNRRTKKSMELRRKG
jgi:hypothetical protein